MMLLFVCGSNGQIHVTEALLSAGAARSILVRLMVVVCGVVDASRQRHINLDIRCIQNWLLAESKDMGHVHTSARRSLGW